MPDKKFSRFLSGDYKNKDELRNMIKSLVDKAVEKAVDKISETPSDYVKSSPNARKDLPAVRKETPAARTETPAARKDLPAVRTDLPAVRTETPAVRTETPAVRTETPAAQTNSPSPDDGYAKPQPIPLTRTSVPHREAPPKIARDNEQLTFTEAEQEPVYKYINAYIPHDEPTEQAEPTTGEVVKQALSSEARARAKFGEMQLIGRINYHGFVTSEAMEEVFVKQGRFMENFTDDYVGNAFCGEFCPVYNNMTFAQLRTYFTWRVNARRGIFTKTDATYARLYAFELLNGIGTMSQTDGINRLIELWEKCRVFDNGLDFYMPTWIRDFYAFSDIVEDYSVYSDTFPVKPKIGGDEYEIADHNYAKKLDFLNSRSSYNYYESKFFECPYGKLAADCLERVLTALDGYFAENGVSLPQLLIGRMKESRMWRPFRGAIYLLADSYPNRTRVINPCERYIVKKGQWTYERLEVTAVYRNFNAYILKSIEAGLREKTAFRYSILPNLQLAMGDFHTRPKVRELIEGSAFTSLINTTVDEFFAQTGIPLYALSQKKRKEAEHKAVLAEKQKPIKVEIDVAKLAQIRAVSDELTKKLIVDEELSSQKNAAVSGHGEQAELYNEFDEEQPYIDGMITGGSDDSADLPEKASALSGHTLSVDKAPSAGQTTPAGTPHSPDSSVSTQSESNVENSSRKADPFSTLPPGWSTFARQLTDIDFKVLGAFFGGNVFNECSKLGIMAELAFEQINEKALDAVSDTVIENGALIDDYREDIKAVLDVRNERCVR